MIRGIHYHEASVLSGKSEMLTGQTLADYTNSYRILLYITAAVTMLAFVLALFIHDVPRDYRSTADDKEPSREDGYV